MFISRMVKQFLFQLLYGAKVWILTKQSEKKLQVFENIILRRICEPIQENGEWKLRKNRELRTLYKDPDVIEIVKSKRLKWLGQVQRREHQIIKRGWIEKPDGTRPLGRSRIWWTDQVLGDLISN